MSQGNPPNKPPTAKFTDDRGPDPERETLLGMFDRWTRLSSQGKPPVPRGCEFLLVCGVRESIPGTGSPVFGYMSGQRSPDGFAQAIAAVLASEAVSMHKMQPTFTGDPDQDPASVLALLVAQVAMRSIEALEMILEGKWGEFSLTPSEEEADSRE